MWIGVFQHYYNHIFDGVPTFVLAFAGLYLLLAICVAFVGKKRFAFSFLSFGYALLLLYLTLFSRETCDNYKFNYIPFSSYFQIANGDKYLLPQVIMNVVVFIPFGFLISLLVRERRWEKILFAGFAFSGLIEIMQLLLNRGTAEVDDVIHNVIGCFVGYLVFCAVDRLFLWQDYRKKEIMH